ncbi:MAG TPA: PPK2 family polyphosphate kinase [Roseiarcus sp.]|jgi:PPK2 family polyphosphate:nucleotide phosphotransferase|nr:PPK2 family polyphosphate kinase [Roseiarcus sp.]
MDYRKQFIAPPGRRLKIVDADPSFADPKVDKVEAERIVETNRLRIAEAHMRLYAEGRHSLLIVLQGLDTAGKDGVVTRIFRLVNPLGCRAISFKQPSVEEASHDFLWRAHLVAPPAGAIAIFNRSYYEGVLVERVHNLVDRKTLTERYRQINDFERLLTETGTTIIKFFLNISEGEQLKRFKERLEDPSKQWKVSDADYREREYWKDYMAAYEEALAQCSLEHAPWYVIPANHKWFRDLAASEILADTMDAMKIANPKPSVDLEKIRELYRRDRRRMGPE